MGDGRETIGYGPDGAQRDAGRWTVASRSTAGAWHFGAKMLASRRELMIYTI
jgi:hypothetical protein